MNNNTGDDVCFNQQKIDSCVENICLLGCRVVEDTISAGTSRALQSALPEAKALTAAEGNAVIEELRELMAVYSHSQFDY